MNNQSCDFSYRAALDAATAELDDLFEETRRLRNRMEQIDDVIGALKQLLEISEPGCSLREMNPELVALA
jgi:hypothetical protein